MYRLILLMVCLVQLSGCTRSHLDIFPPLDDPSLVNKMIPADQLRADIDALVEGVLLRHPDLSGYTRLADVQAAATELKQQIDGPMTRVAFFRLVGQLSHHFNDGHSFLIWPYQEYNALVGDGAQGFPFHLERTPFGLFIKHAYQQGEQHIAAGTRVLSINGVDSETLMDTAQRYVGGETRLLREHTVAARFAPMLWSVFGFIDEFALELANEQGATTLMVRSGDNWQLSDDAGAQGNAEHYYKRLKPGVGYLYIGSFDTDPDQFETFIDQTFTSVQDDQLQHLIVDIRDNTGGNTDAPAYLSRYLANKPFSMVSSVKEKLNPDNRGWLDHKGDIGDIIRQPWNETLEPMANGRRFGGNTWLLVSPLSYSAAIVFATTLQDNGFATLIGQTTGGYANQTAQGNLFNLPHSQLRAYVATRLLVRPSGDTTVGGVVPDIIIEKNQAALTSGQDIELDAALAAIENR
ncbi:peptidase S41 [Aestuariibacter halophilus]|uniref:Peptidase S41 n=1 Tax=Fluctibacter halophilus TaxID=226011 RepID=A0ABS8G6M2_9ALTE|nr:S41 family peptidase [Aestuariibacter halophilus]MCC2616242.1 peptidase S41 [Aestuariibacter halophilus]